MTTLSTHDDVWSVSVTKRLNVLPALFHKYHKTLHLHTFYSNILFISLKHFIIWLLLITCDNMWSLSLRKSGMFTCHL